MLKRNHAISIFLHTHFLYISLFSIQQNPLLFFDLVDDRCGGDGSVMFVCYYDDDDDMDSFYYLTIIFLLLLHFKCYFYSNTHFIL